MSITVIKLIIMHLSPTELQKCCMSKHSVEGSARCTCSRVRHPAGSAGIVYPRGNKDTILWVQNSCSGGGLGRKLHKICSKSSKSVFGEKAFFSTNIDSSKADALQSSFALCFCSLYGFLKLPYTQDGRFLDNICGKWKFVSFSLKKYKTCMQKNNFPRVCTTKHPIKEEIYACSQIEQNPMSSSK